LAPVVTETEAEETKFEEEWAALQDKLNIYHYMSRVDRLSVIGQYAVLLIGADDDLGWEQPLEGTRNIKYLMVYDELSAKIKDYDTDSKSERFGLPLTYSIATTVASSGSAFTVHHSRLIHVAYDPLENDVLGTSILNGIYNRLEDWEKVVGGSAEMFWRGAMRSLWLDVREGAGISPQDKAAVKTEFTDFSHNLSRTFQTEGMDVKTIEQQLADPSSSASVILDEISAATRIPKRILLGSERGELASTQDEKSWTDNIDQRRRDHDEMRILRPFINRCIELGVLTEPKDKYTVVWPDLLTPSNKDKAEVAKIKTEALKSYADALGAADILPPDFYLLHFLGLTQDELDQVNELIGEQDSRVNLPEEE
jgi:hypothetical protein